jgi:iron-sulfur cluster repair protein YtfE (RIC family)
MTTINHASRARLKGTVDFTIMFVSHDAFERDLRRLVASVKLGGTGEAATRTGWETFKHQLHVHHTAEDTSIWPALRTKLARRDDEGVLDAMESEHAGIDPLLARVDASLASGDEAGLAESVNALNAALLAHIEHEETDALPLVETFLGPKGWAAFVQQMRKTNGLRGAAEFFPWMLDDTPANTRKQVLGLLPPPARLLYRAVWRPGYARTPRWGQAA